MMRWLLRGIVVAACLWGGYWFFGSRGLDQAARDWFIALPQSGLAGSYADLSVQGFPNRFDLTVTEPRLADPKQGLAWQAPFLQVFSLTYKPWHLIAAFPPEQHLTLNGMDLALTAGKLQASLVVSPSTSLALDRTVLAGDDLALLVDGVKAAHVESLRFATRTEASLANTHDAGLTFKNLTLPPALSEQAIAADLPGAIDAFAGRVLITFSTALDRFVAQTQPQIEILNIKDATLTWGDIVLFAKGELRPDAQGFAIGTVSLEITNWEHGLAAAVKSGLVAPDAVESWRNAGQFLARQSGAAGRLDLPLTFFDAQMRLGPFTLGPAPRLR